jgi:hypothetical protein
MDEGSVKWKKSKSRVERGKGHHCSCACLQSASVSLLELLGMYLSSHWTVTS